MMKLNLIALMLFVAVFTTCTNDASLSSKYIADRVIIIVIDGPRYQDTWDMYGRPLIPERVKLAKMGMLFTNFKNTGQTFTNPGHTSIATGVNQGIDNSGSQLPDQPSIFQYYLKEKKMPASKCQIIASKDKLWVLSDCKNSSWSSQFNPEYDCGNAGPHSGYRDDATTYAHAIKNISTAHPNLALIQFKEPDASGHSGVWESYIRGIQSTDYYVSLIYKYLQQDRYYAGRTALLITNDHGRHSDGVADGFVNHGDNCAGCRKIEFLAIGPDFKKGVTVSTAYSQVDIASTIGKILGFKTTYSQGKIIQELVQ